MKFKSKPNLFVTVTGKKPKYIRFDEKGFYETEDAKLIERMKKHFEVVKEKVKAEVKKTEEVKKTTTKRKAKCSTKS